MAGTKARTRRAGGIGAIYKDGNGYHAQVVIGYKPESGDPIVKKVRTATHAEAVEALARLQLAHRTGKLEQSKTSVLADFVHSWLTAKIEPFRAPKTAQQYKWILTTHVLPTLGRKRLDQVKRRDVQALASALAKQTVKPKCKDEDAHYARLARRAAENGEPAPERKPPKLLSSRTIQSAVTVLHAVFEEAIKDVLCSTNPCSHIDLSRSAKKPAQFLEPKQVGKLLEAIKTDPMGPLIRFLLATGARSGEARGLRWQDVDLEKGIVRIGGQLQALDGKLQYRPTTKTNQDRLLPIPAWLVEDLKRLRIQQDVDGYEDPDGIVFLNPHGRRIHETNLNKCLQAACARAEITPVSPHKLRHTVATLAMMETGDRHAVQKLLGHQQGRLTSDLYGHAKAESLRPVANALGRVLQPSPTSETAMEG